VITALQPRITVMGCLRSFYGFGLSSDHSDRSRSHLPHDLVSHYIDPRQDLMGKKKPDPKQHPASGSQRCLSFLSAGRLLFLRLFVFNDRHNLGG
jgi:hypothetical protein